MYGNENESKDKIPFNDIKEQLICRLIKSGYDSAEFN